MFPSRPFFFCILIFFIALLISATNHAENSEDPVLNQIKHSPEQTRDKLLSNQEKVVLQLKWRHQFQFAGYYAAKELGYYADEGLEVEIRERDPEQPTQLPGQNTDVDYSIVDSSILAAYSQGLPVKALAAIFQHNPLVFISKRDSGIISPYEMIGKRIMIGSEGIYGAPLQALFNLSKIDSEQFTAIPYRHDISALEKDEIDVMPVYLTSEVFYYHSRNIPLNIIDPHSYGIDLYGDILITSFNELSQHPGRAERFRRASLKGWKYALENMEELILITKKRYGSKKSIDELRFEAQQTYKMILPETIPLGEITPLRLRRVANIYSNLNLSNPLSDKQLNHFIYGAENQLHLTADEQAWLAKHPVIRVGIDRDFAPFEWINEKNQYLGMTADYMALIENSLGVRFQIIKDKTWQETLDMAKKGQLEMLSNANDTPERRAYLNFTSSYINSPIVIISDGRYGFIGELEELKGKKVAIESGYFMQDILQRDYPEIQLIPTKNEIEALKLLADETADAYVGDGISLNFIIQQEGLLNLRFSGQTQYRSQHRIAVTKDNPELLSILSKALNSISSEERNQILRRWMGLQIEQGLKRELVFSYLLIAFIIGLLFIYWIYRLRKEVLARKNAETELRAILETEPECVKVVDSDGILLQMNQAGLTMVEAEDDPSQAINQKVIDFIVPEDRPAFEQMSAEVLNGKEVTLEFQINGLKGTRRYMESHAVPFTDKTTGKTAVLAVTRDITEKKKADNLIWTQANFDALTHLPNRRLFLDRLEQSMKASSREKKRLALLFIDLDRFKEVNDSLGHHMGDILLIEAGQRIKNCVRASDTVARLGGDEFTVILPELAEVFDVSSVALNIIKSLRETYHLGEEQAYVSASIGITIYPDDAQSIHDMLKNADQAMYAAKQAGRNGYHYFTPAMQEAAQERQRLMKDMHYALEREEFLIYYQPIIQLKNGHIHKAEALLRWQHPDLGFISPAAFIPIAEDTGAIHDIGHWIFEQCSKQAKKWRSEFSQDFQISVNKSPVQFLTEDNSQRDWVLHMQQSGLAAESIVVEITEGLLLDANINVRDKLLKYRDAGIQVAIDDFGTGYSSLAYLKRFDIDYLKIDQSFIRNLENDLSDRALSEAIVVMAHKLGLKVIAEGVETEQQRQILATMGCDYAQGYLYSKPISASEFEQYLCTTV